MSSIEIFDNTLLKLIIRKGPNSDRLSTTLDSGELGYTIDTKRVFVGDGSTAGGNVVGNKFLGRTDQVINLGTLPAVVGDVGYSTTQSTLYYIQSSTGLNANDWYPIASYIDPNAFASVSSAVSQISAPANSAYGTVKSLSSNWSSVHSTVQANSASWSSALTLVQANSASWLGQDLIFAITPQLTALTVGTNKLSFNIPYDYYIQNVYMTCAVAPTTQMVFDVNRNGTSIFNQPSAFTIEPSQFYSATSTSTISGNLLAENDRITLDVDNYNGSAITPLGVTFWIIGYKV